LLLYRLDLPRRAPEQFRRLKKLEGRIDARLMIRMNAAAELEGKSFAQAAALFSGEVKGERREFSGTLFGADFWRLTREHLLLVLVSLAASNRGRHPARHRGGEAARRGAADPRRGGG